MSGINVSALFVKIKDPSLSIASKISMIAPIWGQLSRDTKNSLIKEINRQSAEETDAVQQLATKAA